MIKVNIWKISKIILSSSFQGGIPTGYISPPEGSWVYSPVSEASPKRHVTSGFAQFSHRNRKTKRKTIKTLVCEKKQHKYQIVMKLFVYFFS